MSHDDDELGSGPGRRLSEQITIWYKMALQVGTLAGFVLVSYYFMTIQYFPLGDLQSFASIFLYVSLMSFVLFGSLMLCLFFAPYFWMKSVLATVETCELVVGMQALKVTCTIANNDYINDADTEYPSRNICWKYLILPLIYVPMLLVFKWLEYKAVFYGFILFGIICLYCSLFLFPSFKYEYQKNIGKKIDYRISDDKSKTIAYIKIFFASVASSTILVCGVLLSSLIFLQSDDAILYKIFFAEMLVILSGVTFIIRETKDSIRNNMLIVTGMFMLYLMSTDLDKIVLRNMRMASLGSFDATLIVDKAACDLLHQQQYPVICSANLPSYQVKKVKILWRGAEYYIQYNGEDHKMHRVIVSSTHISGLELYFPSDGDNQKNTIFI